MNSFQPQNHGQNLTTISLLRLSSELLMLIFSEGIYSLRYNTLITENGDV